MNGVDWEAVRKKYEALLPHVASRYDLTYILGEMVGELSNSHTYVNGPEETDLHPVAEGLLGADYELDEATGCYRFEKIYPGENWDAQSRSPLTEPGMNVKEGDYLLAVNGRPLKGPQSPDELLVEHRQRNHRDHRQFQALTRRGAHHRRQAAGRRIPIAHERHDRDQPQEGRCGHQRPRGLCLHSRHGRRRPQRLRQAILPADSQRGHDHRRSLQRRRLRRSAHLRAAAPRALWHGLGPQL